MRRWGKTRYLICGICGPLFVAVVAVPGKPVLAVSVPGPAAIHLVSIASDGGASDGWSAAGTEKGLDVSAHGRYVVFSSYAANLVTGDRNGQRDVFVRDMVRGRTVLASMGVGGVQGNAESRQGSISADGRFVAFNSAASNLVPGDTNDTGDVFVRDLWRHRTILASTGAGGIADQGAHQPDLSADGRHVAFTSSATNLVAGDTSDQDVFVRDLGAARTELVSVGPAGEQPESPASQPSLSADGRHVAFIAAADLVPGPAPEPSAFVDGVVYVRDRVARTTRAVSYGIPVDPRALVIDAAYPALSGDGRVVVFAVIGWWGPDPIPNVWLRDLRTGAAELISADRRGRPSTVVWPVHRADVSAGGRYVAFGSAALLTRGDSGALSDVFVRDRRTGGLTWITRAQDQTDPFGGRLGSIGPAISADGQHVAFDSDDSRLAPPGGSGFGSDTYLWSRSEPGNPRS
jgi:Tol biopolymer transport system component